MNALNPTPIKLAFGLVVVAICLLIVGAYYTGAVTEHRLAYQAFRAWAFNIAGLSMLALGCSTFIANLAWRRMRPAGNVSA
jgi:Zn-dependent protease with chaperone function